MIVGTTSTFRIRISIFRLPMGALKRSRGNVIFVAVALGLASQHPNGQITIHPVHLQTFPRERHVPDGRERHAPRRR
jgi:hypothetical protein